MDFNSDLKVIAIIYHYFRPEKTAMIQSYSTSVKRN